MQKAKLKLLLDGFEYEKVLPAVWFPVQATCSCQVIPAGFPWPQHSA
jgi:hypothetical protein